LNEITRPVVDGTLAEATTYFAIVRLNQIVLVYLKPTYSLSTVRNQDSNIGSSIEKERRNLVGLQHYSGLELSLDRKHIESTLTFLCFPSDIIHASPTLHHININSHPAAVNPDHDKTKRLLPRQGVYPPRSCIERRLSDRAERSFADYHTIHTSHKHVPHTTRLLLLSPDS
jgi:hypothetical protein